MAQFWYFFFPRKGGELYNFGNNFSWPRGHTDRICASLGRWYVTLDQSFSAPSYFISIYDPVQQARCKVLYLVPWSRCENEQKVREKIGWICLLFLPMKSRYIILRSDNKRLKKVVMLFLTSSRR